MRIKEAAAGSSYRRPYHCSCVSLMFPVAVFVRLVILRSEAAFSLDVMAVNVVMMDRKRQRSLVVHTIAVFACTISYSNTCIQLVFLQALCELICFPGVTCCA